MADLVSAERAQAILDVCSVYPVGYPPIVAASVQLQKATCALLEAAPDLAETVVSLHAEVKRLSTANIDLLAEAMRLTDRVSDLTLDLHGEREKVAAAEVTRDAALKERDEARAEVTSLDIETFRRLNVTCAVTTTMRGSSPRRPWRR